MALLKGFYAPPPGEKRAHRPRSGGWRRVSKGTVSESASEHLGGRFRAESASPRVRELEADRPRSPRMLRDNEMSVGWKLREYGGVVEQSILRHSPPHLIEKRTVRAGNASEAMFRSPRRSFANVRETGVSARLSDDPPRAEVFARVPRPNGAHLKDGGVSESASGCRENDPFHDTAFRGLSRGRAILMTRRKEISTTKENLDRGASYEESERRCDPKP